MAKYTVLFELSAQKSLQKMDKSQSNMILSWIKKNLVDTDNPRRHGKALSGNLSGRWRYRVGDYRIIAHITDSTITVLILDIGHRNIIYTT